MPDNEDTDVVELAARTTPVRVATNIPEPTVDELPIGVDLNLPFITPYKNQWELQREDDISVEKLVSMRKTDGQARALYRLMTLPVLAALKGSSFIPAKGKEGGTKEAEFVEQMFMLPKHAGGMEISFRKVMEHFLLALFDGFSAAELVTFSPKNGPLKGKWTIKEIAPRPAETISFLLDERGKFDGLRQRAYLKGEFLDEVIPRERALYYAANESEKPFYGQSFFHAAFFHWDKKVRTYYLAHLMAQRSAVGVRHGTYPKNADPKKINKFIKQVSDLGTNQWMVTEAEYELDSLKEGGSFDFLGLINHHNGQMSKSVLAEFFDQNQGAGQNDGAFVDFGKQSDAMFILLLESVTGALEELINVEIIPRFIQWNFNNDMYPTFKWGPITNEQRAAILEMFKQLMVASNQGNVTPDFVFGLEKKTADAIGLELDYETIEREREEQAKAEKVAADEAAAQQKQLMDAQLAAAQPQPTPEAAPTEGTESAPLDIPESLLPQGFTQ